VKGAGLIRRLVNARRHWDCLGWVDAGRSGRPGLEARAPPLAGGGLLNITQITNTMESQGGGAARCCKGLSQARWGQCRLPAGRVAGPPHLLGGTEACYPWGVWLAGDEAGYPRGTWLDPLTCWGGTEACYPRAAWLAGDSAGRSGRPGLAARAVWAAGVQGLICVC